MKILFFYALGLIGIISGILDLKKTWKTEPIILKHFAIGQIFCGAVLLISAVMMTLGHE